MMKIPTALPKFTKHPKKNFRIEPHQVDIWQFSLTTPPKDPQTLLSQEEIQRAYRYYFQKHQIKSLTSQSIVKQLLAKYLGVTPIDVQFERNKYGKPYLFNAPALQFNLTHSKDFALLAVGRTHALGVDVEYFTPRPYEGIASHIFSDGECKTLEKLPHNLKALGFFRVWPR